MKTTCAICGSLFDCGANDKEPCWCCRLPNIMPLDANSCLCEACLKKKIEELHKPDISTPNGIFELLKNLKSDATPRFGNMSAQHMVEHLAFAISFSNGKLPQQLMVNEETARTIRYYTIQSHHEMTPGYKAPMLGDEPPPLIHPNLKTAIEALKNEIDDFNLYFKDKPLATPVSPVIGELNQKEWIIFHNKHLAHHFRQFSLIE